VQRWALTLPLPSFLLPCAPQGCHLADATCQHRDHVLLHRGGLPALPGKPQLYALFLGLGSTLNCVGAAESLRLPPGCSSPWAACQSHAATLSPPACPPAFPLAWSTCPAGDGALCCAAQRCNPRPHQHAGSAAGAPPRPAAPCPGLQFCPLGAGRIRHCRVKQAHGWAGGRGGCGGWGGWSSARLCICMPPQHH
jgi:hypothetical protein